jgi:excisionase family DNA binding protein
MHDTREHNPFATINSRLSNLESLALEALQYLRSRNSSTSDPDEIGGMKLAKQVLGLSEPRIYALVSDGTLPHFKKGNRLFFSRAELVAWVKEGRRSTQLDAAA